MIGIFDSGLGGLSALKEVHTMLPHEDIIYFGDTGRVPYGTRSKETIIKYALQDMNFLVSKNIDAVLIACGTVSSNAMEALREKYPDIPIVGVIESAAKAAAETTKNKKIGIAATSATIASGAFDRLLKSIDSEIKITGIPCPLFVSLVENGFIAPDDQVTRLVAERYLGKLRGEEVDTLILACTHFPIISETISKVVPAAKLINVSLTAALELKRILGENRKAGNGRIEYYVSDEPNGFNETAAIFLREKIDCAVKRIDIEKY